MFLSPAFTSGELRLQESHKAVGEVVQSQAQPWQFVGESALLGFNNSNVSPGGRNSQEGGGLCLPEHLLAAVVSQLIFLPQRHDKFGRQSWLARPDYLGEPG